MNDRKTSSMLQRIPVILAVTAASYGLQVPTAVARPGHAPGAQATAKSQGKAPAVVAARRAQAHA